MTPVGNALTSKLITACEAASLKPSYVLHFKASPIDLTLRLRSVYPSSSNHEKHAGQTLCGQWSSGLGEHTLLLYFRIIVSIHYL